MDDYGADGGNPGEPKWLVYLRDGVPTGSVFGIEIRLHFLLIVPMFYMWSFVTGLPLVYALPLFLFSLLALFGSILLHELGHCYGAFRVGGHAERILLWPLGGLAMVHGANKGPRQELIVTALGPAVNLALGVLFSALWFIGARLNLHFLAVFAVKYVASINWALFWFNVLLPLFPMDSARLVRGAASCRWHPNRVTYWLTTVGMWLGGAVAVLGFFSHAIEQALASQGIHGLARFIGAFGPITGFIGLFGAFASWQERKICQMVDVYEDGPWYWRHSLYRSETAPNAGSLWRDLKKGLKSLFKFRQGRSPARVIDMASRPSSAGRHESPERRRARASRSSNPREETLRGQLDRAVAEEDFEEAARIRDELRKLKK